MVKTCTRCGEQKPATREFYGSTPSGGLKGFCRTCMNKASRAYEENNKSRRRERDAKRAEAGKGARSSFDIGTKEDFFTKQNGYCPCCMKPIRRPEEGEIDHVIPLSRGGQHDPSNFLLVHRQCNKEKHGKTLVEHWAWRVNRGLDAENLGAKYGLLTRKRD